VERDSEFRIVTKIKKAIRITHGAEVNENRRDQRHSNRSSRYKITLEKHAANEACFSSANDY
jgi:hypothetical protein